MQCNAIAAFLLGHVTSCIGRAQRFFQRHLRLRDTDEADTDGDV